MKGALLTMLILLGTTPLRAVDRPPFDLTTLLGETYHNCRIIKVTPVGLTVAYDNGVSKVPFELLGDAWKELYHYDPDKAQKFAEREEEKRQQAEARRKELQRAMEQQRNQHMTELVKAEQQREDLEAKLAKEQAETAAKAAPGAPPASTTPPLAPFPGDPVVPQFPPISNIYTPNQPIIITNDGSMPGYTPSPGGGYSGGGYPFTYVPGYVYPPVTVTPRPPFRGQSGGMGRRPGPPGRMPFHQ